MKITETTVRKILITGAFRREGLGTLDAISVMVEDFKPGQGEITITCFGDAWSYYWSHMGEDNKLMDFFCKCDKHYLVGKLKNGIKNEIDDDDEDALGKLLKSEILKERRSGDITKRRARDLWDEASFVDYGNHHNICAEVLGDEWWYRTPKKPNPEYDFLCDIVETVKTAFKQIKEQQ